jgi:pimeloyl-ACP methyl ester carboxylesterase
VTSSPFEPTDPTVIADLGERLRRFRPVPGVGLNGDRGVDASLVDRLVRHWITDFDWATQEARIAAYPWEQTSRSTVPIRAIVSRAPTPAPVVLLLHGWPDSVLRFERLFPHLSDVTVVAPALPGFPFAAPSPGMSGVAMAGAVAQAMSEFGFDRYVVSAGDIGSDVAEALAGRHPAAVAALHLTDVSQLHYLVDPPADLTEEERAYVAYGHRWQAAEGGYMHEQSTRPNTLAVGLGDSPAGLAAWIVEKLIRWTDSDGELGRVFTDDEALTWVTAYWVTGAIGTSFGPYAANAPMDWARVEAPTVFTIFPKDLVNAPRRFAERYFNVVDWRAFERGGHFAAWERPEEYLWGLRRALEHCRESP